MVPRVVTIHIVVVSDRDARYLILISMPLHQRFKTLLVAHKIARYSRTRVEFLLVQRVRSIDIDTLRVLINAVSRFEPLVVAVVLELLMLLLMETDTLSLMNHVHMV